MTRSQGVKNLAVSFLMIIAGIVLLLIQSIIKYPLVQYIFGGILILIGIGIMGDRNKLPATIALLVGIAIIIIRGLIPGLVGFIGWIILIAGVVIGLLSFLSIKQTV